MRARPLRRVRRRKLLRQRRHLTPADRRRLADQRRRTRERWYNRQFRKARGAFYDQLIKSYYDRRVPPPWPGGLFRWA